MRRTLKGELVIAALGNRYDNTVSESFFASLRMELDHSVSFATRTEAYDANADSDDNFYNLIRRHPAIGCRSPAEHEFSF